jgi:hypothetical protein
MSIKGKAYIASAFEHSTRKAVDKSFAQLCAEAAKGALGDAGLTEGGFPAAMFTPGTNNTSK